MLFIRNFILKKGLIYICNPFYNYQSFFSIFYYILKIMMYNLQNKNKENNCIICIKENYDINENKSNMIDKDFVIIDLYH